MQPFRSIGYLPGVEFFLSFFAQLLLERNLATKRIDTMTEQPRERFFLLRGGKDLSRQRARLSHAFS